METVADAIVQLQREIAELKRRVAALEQQQRPQRTPGPAPYTIGTPDPPMLPPYDGRPPTGGIRR